MKKQFEISRLLALLSLVFAGSLLSSSTSAHASAALVFPRATQDTIASKWATTLPNEYEFLRSFYFIDRDFFSLRPIDLDEQNLDLGRFRGTAQQLINLVKNWVSPFPVKDPRPRALLSDLKIDLTWARLDAKINAQKTQAWTAETGNSGIVMDISGVIPDVKAWLEEVRLSDLENPFLTEIIIKQIHGYTHTYSRPLEFHTTAKIAFTQTPAAITPHVEFGPIESNLEDLDVGLFYGGRVEVPTIALIVNGRRFNLRGERVQSHVATHLPEITHFLQKLIQTKGRLGISGSMTRAMAEYFPVSPTFNLPIHEPVETTVGLTPSAVYLSARESLGIELTTDPTEPQKNWKRAITALENTGLANPSRLPDSRSHFFVGMSIPMIQGLVDQAFRAGQWNAIHVPGLNQVSLAKAPVLTSAANGVFDVALTVRTHISGIGNFFVHNPFEFSFKAKTRWSTSHPGRLELIQADLRTIQIDPSRIDRLPRLVHRNIRKKLKKWNKHLASEPFILMNGFPFPPQVLGFSLHTQNVQTDSTSNTLWVQIAIE